MASLQPQMEIVLFNFAVYCHMGNVPTAETVHKCQEPSFVISEYTQVMARNQTKQEGKDSKEPEKSVHNLASLTWRHEALITHFSNHFIFG